MKEQMVLGLAMIVLLSSNAKFGAVGVILEKLSSGFCLTAQNVTRCPTPPTFDLVDMNAFGGKWYEIGSTARFKLKKEAGIACSQTNYTVMTSSQFWGPKTVNLTFVDKGVKAVGSVGQFGVQQVDEAARGICQKARDICKLLGEGSKIDQALKLVTSAGDRIALMHPGEFATLQTARASIVSAIGAANAALDSLSKNVTQIQFMDSQLSQGNGSLKDNMVMLINVSMRAGSVQDDIQNAVKTISDARGKIMQVAAKLVAVGGIDIPIKEVPSLGKAALLLSASESSLFNMAAAVRLSTFGIAAVSGLIPLDKGKVGDYVSAHPGVAIQNASFPGRLEAEWGSGNRAPYLILAVDGLSHAGYNAALVYSCTEIPGRNYKQALFIISRIPTLSQLVIDNFMNVATFHGISTDCDDPFLYTLQNSPLCVPPTPPPIPVSP